MDGRNVSRRKLLHACSCIAALLVSVMLSLAWRGQRQPVADARDRANDRDRAATNNPYEELPVSHVPVSPFPTPPHLQNVRLMRQTAGSAMAKSEGCIACHRGVEDMHNSSLVSLGCTDCHGGDATTTNKARAHVHAKNPKAWTSSANPVRSYTLLNHESPEFIQFVNPGDLRVAHLSCGTIGCHGDEVLQVRKSMMTHGCMLWGAALYNNGGVPFKRARYGESYSMRGKPLRLQTVPAPTLDEIKNKGVVPFLDPLPRFEISQPGNVLRIFERGGRFKLETGIPETKEEPGRPRARLSNRGLGTLNRTDPVFIGLQKTRLLDPTLNFLGTNDHAGDYRSSGCTACHVIYANDRSPVHSGPYAKFGNRGMSFSTDPMIPKNEPGHPIHHKFSLTIPTSQCVGCHVHPGTSVMNSYLGFMWWDNETDGEFMYPAKQKHLTPEQLSQSLMSNPNEAAARGLWSDPEFLHNVSHLNSHLRHTQFADFTGHGWVFRAVYKKDRKGQLLDYKGTPIHPVSNAQLQAAMVPPTSDERKFGKRRPNTPVHYLDIHLEKGMHCIDCHFRQDVHGNTKLYQEVRAATEITCTDCHGTLTEVASLRTSGPAAPERDASRGPSGTNLTLFRTPWGKPRFERIDNRVIQRSMVEKELYWDVTQVKNTVDPSSPDYNEKSALAKTVRHGGVPGQLVWGDLPKDQERKCAHSNSNMSCIACHSSWNTSCYGCHLPQKANRKVPGLHNEGNVSRNLVSYNFQTLRDDVFMLARDGDVTGNRIGPSRSSCAIHVSSYNQNRESVYVQQQTISADGLSGIAFSTNVPHTVRGGPPRGAGVRNNPAHRAMMSETKMCTDCHVSVKEDNNAIMAQLFMQGTQSLNFIGRYCWVAAGEHGLEAVVVTEQEEPQAVIGSSLQRIAFPENYQKHIKANRKLKHAHEHPGFDPKDRIFSRLAKKQEVLMVQARGEYLYAACGKGGLRVFDIAAIDNKGFSERIVTAPVSPVGQRFYVRTKYATAVAAPTTIAPDPTRKRNPENKEPAVHALYAYLYVCDKYEGLILVGAGTLLDGIPTNNFLKRALTYNPNGILAGARNITFAGTYAYICCDIGIVVLSLDDPLKPTVTSIIQAPDVFHPKTIDVQFRYAFVGDEEGLKVFDITDMGRPVLKSKLGVPDVHSIYVGRTYAYIAAGKHGLVIVDVEQPLMPKLYTIYNADGKINDTHDVKLGITNVSQFAYLADGKNGLRVVQLTSPQVPGNDGFSTAPAPYLVATYKLPKEGHALWVSKGMDRDRAVDESGNQIAVFGRIGARPLSYDEQRKMFIRSVRGREYLWRVSDDPSHPIFRPTRPDFLNQMPPPGLLPARR